MLNQMPCHPNNLGTFKQVVGVIKNQLGKAKTCRIGRAMNILPVPGTRTFIMQKSTSTIRGKSFDYYFGSDAKTTPTLAHLCACKTTPTLAHLCACKTTPTLAHLCAWGIRLDNMIHTKR